MNKPSGDSGQQPAEAVAFVPVHPRSGPLWMDTYPAGDPADGRSPHYPRMPLYTAKPTAFPNARTLAAALWRDWMTNEQADGLGADIHRWLLAYAALSDPPPAIDIGKLRELYDAAGKGFHISETCGPDGKYWHVSKFPGMASLHAFVDAWTDVMRDMRGAK